MTIVNNAASIHQRILNKAKSEQRPVNELLQYYAMERFLYRLGISPHRKNFVLKGALVFLAWQVQITRPTRDIDLLGFTDNTPENLISIVKDIFLQSVEDDGLYFDPESVHGEVIIEDADYQGVRIQFTVMLGKAKIPMRLDVGFSDVIIPNSIEAELSTILETSQSPCVRAYPPETVISEKFQAMVALGMINSRMKDFFDIWYLMNKFDFDYQILQKAIMTTFNNRNTSLPDMSFSAFSTEFAEQKQPLWTVFITKNKLSEVPSELMDVTTKLAEFFNPIISPTNTLPAHWSSKNGWKH